MSKTNGHLKLFKLLCCLALFLVVGQVPATSSKDSTSRPEVKKALDDFVLAEERRIRLWWFPPKIYGLKKEPNPPVVRFEIRRDGQPTNIRLEKTSGHKMLDLSAINAIKHCGLKSGLPEELPDRFALRYVFDYDALKVGSDGPAGRFYPSRLYVVTEGLLSPR